MHGTYEKSDWHDKRDSESQNIVKGMIFRQEKSQDTQSLFKYIKGWQHLQNSVLQEKGYSMKKGSEGKYS